MAWCFLAFFSRRAYLGTIVCCFVFDVISSFAVYLLGKAGQDNDEHHPQTIDVLLFSLLRVIVEPLLFTAAYKVYARTAAKSPLQLIRTQSAEPTPGDSVTMPGSSDLSAPLNQEANSVVSTDAPSSTATSQMSHLEAQREHALLMRKAEQYKVIVMGICFAFVTFNSIYNGLKCVGYPYDPSRKSIQGAAFAMVMLFINAEFFLLREFLGDVTQEEGELLVNLHMHPLYFEIGLKCHQCDICFESMKGPHYIAYRCRTCDFDLCPRCYRKKNDPTARGFGARAIRRDGEQITTWTFFKRIVQMTLEFGHISTLAIVALIGTQSMQIWAPSITGKIFDSIDKYTKHPETGMGPFQKAMLLYLGVSIFQGAFNGLKSLAQELVMRHLAYSVRAKLFQSVIRMDISFFDSMHTGQLTSRLTNDASQMVQPLNTLLNDLIANAMLLVGGVFMAFHTSWKLSMLALTVVPPITFSYRIYARWGRKINRSMQCAMGEANGIATEAMQNIRTVRGFSTEQHESEKYEDGIGTALAHGRKSAKVGASVNAFSTYLNLGTAVLILWYGGTQVCESKGEEMSLGKLVTYQLYWNMMNTAFISMSNVFNDLIRASSAAERVFSLIDARPEVDPDAGDQLQKDSFSGYLQLQSVQFRYKTRPENLVLKSVDLHMEPATVTALVGKSGGGKSTLVHLLMRFYEPTGGKLLLDGRDMTELSSRSVRKFCGFVAQDTQLFAKSIEENLAYGLGRPYTKDELIKACKAANAHEFIMETEDQYETRVGERGMMLSGGQRQRLAIARCFLRQPKLLFLDEATSALDAENEGIVQQSLDALIEEMKCTVVLIAHRLCTVIDANQIAVVHKGSVLERGNHKQLMKLGGIYAKLVHRQTTRDSDTASKAVSAKPVNGKQAKKMQTEIDDLIEELEATPEGILGCTSTDNPCDLTETLGG